MSNLTYEIANEFIKYEPETGVFTWNRKTGTYAKQYIGDQAGSPDRSGYIRIQILGRKYAAHRLAYLLMIGAWPKNTIDHINGCRSDNRWLNLRAATQSENCINSKVRISSRSGIKGVSPSGKKWQVLAYRNQQQFYLGTFETKEQAHLVYEGFAKANYGEFYKNKEVNGKTEFIRSERIEDE